MDEIPDSLSPESSSASLGSPSSEYDSSPITPSSPSASSSSSSSSGSTQDPTDEDGSSSSGDSQSDSISVNLPGFQSVTAAIFGVPLPSIQDLGLFQAHQQHLANLSSPPSDHTLGSSSDLIATRHDPEGDDDHTDSDDYDDEGFDEEGYDREGYNEEGFDEEGFDREGYDEEGYDEEGYDRQGNPDLDHIRRPRALPITDLEHFDGYQWFQDMAEWLSPSTQDLIDQDNMDVVDDSQYDGSSVFERSSSLFVGDEDNDITTTTSNDNGRAGFHHTTRGSQANIHRFQRSPVGSEYPPNTRALDELVEIDMVRGRRNRETHMRQSDHSSAAPANPSGVIHIDLTGDDDDGDEVPLRRVLDQSQNARRRQSQQRNAPPHFSRTDDSYIGDNESVIDLVSDSDGEQPNTNNANNSHARANQDHHHHHHHHHHHRHRQQPPRPTLPRHHPSQRHASSRPSASSSASIFNLFNLPSRGGETGFLRFFNNAMSGRPPTVEDDISFLGQHPATGGFGLNGLHVPLEMHLDYNRNAFRHPTTARPATPKPQHEPPPAAREGFTRDTGKEDMAYVCAGCNEELAVDPDASPESPPTSSKKPRSKKDKEEHHFWAVKACGHVFCKRCYDNRRPTVKQPVKAQFRVVKPTGKGASKIYCPVDGCDSDVTNKTAWVGLFM